MPELYRRPRSPFWYFDLTLPGGGRRRLSTRKANKREARGVADEMAARLAAEAAVPGSPITLRDAFGRYLEKLRVAGKSSRHNVQQLALRTLGQHTPDPERMRSDRRYRATMARLKPQSFHLDPSLPLHELTSALVARLHAARLASGLSLQTVNHEVKGLRAAARHAKRLGFKSCDLEVELPKPPGKTRYLSWAEFELVFAELDPDRPIGDARGGGTHAPSPLQRRQRQDARDLLVALVMTGGRWSELARMTWDQVDVVGWSNARVYGWKTQAERQVPMPPLASEMFQRRFAARSPREMLVFPGYAGQGSVRTPSKAIYTAIHRAGLNARYRVDRDGKATIHSLRHTFASWLIQRGMSLYEVQKLLGHASPVMTQRYAALADRAVTTKAAELLAAGGA
jgi:integrase